MSTIQNWTETYNIETVNGSDNVYPKQYIIDLFEKCLSSEAIQELEKRNQLGVPENMLKQLLQIPTNGVSWHDFKKTNAHFLKALAYIKNPGCNVYDYTLHLCRNLTPNSITRLNLKISTGR